MVIHFRRPKLAECLSFLGLLFFHGCYAFPTPCEDSIVRETKSPAGNFTAVLSLRNCGATTDYTSLVAITSTGTMYSDGDLVFVAEGDNDIRFYWQDNSTLNVVCESCRVNKIFKQIRSSQSVTIDYEKENSWAQ